jgi:hypothetical protein
MNLYDWRKEATDGFQIQTVCLIECSKFLAVDIQDSPYLPS